MIGVTFYHDFLILVRLLKIDRTFWRQSYIFIFRSRQLFSIKTLKIFRGRTFIIFAHTFSLFINQASLDFFAQDTLSKIKKITQNPSHPNSFISNSIIYIHSIIKRLQSLGVECVFYCIYYKFTRYERGVGVFSF